MGSEAINAPLDVGKTKSEWVWYGSNAALNEGEAVCYDWDYGTDTAREPSRYNRVETPDTLNAQHFAGVAARAYRAVSTGQLIEIYKPGSVCNVSCGKDTNTVVGVGVLTFDVTSGFEGEFRYAGLPGAGSVQPLQTTTGDTSDPGLCLAYLQEGPQSGGAEVLDLPSGGGAIGTLMVGGATLFTGRSVGSGSATATLADGTIPGLRKKFGIITTELTTNDVVLTVTTGVTDDIDDVSLDTVTWANGSTCLDTYASLYWDGAWILQSKTEDVPTLAGS